MKRSGKFYRKNEKQVMEQLGLQPTKNSGSGWIEKEDGQSEHVLCQLKSTDANSIKVSKQDLDTLEYNCMVSHKLPVFAIQFIKSDQLYLVLQPEVLQEVAQYLQTGSMPNNSVFSDLDGFPDLGEHLPVQPNRPVIRSSIKGRQAFHEEQQAKYKKGGKSAL